MRNKFRAHVRDNTKLDAVIIFRHARVCFWPVPPALFLLLLPPLPRHSPIYLLFLNRSFVRSFIRSPRRTCTSSLSLSLPRKHTVNTLAATPSPRCHSSRSFLTLFIFLRTTHHPLEVIRVCFSLLFVPPFHSSFYTFIYVLLFTFNTYRIFIYMYV